MPDQWRIGLPTETEATGDGSMIAILKRIRTLLGGTGSVRITDGTDTATVRPLGSAGALDVSIVDGSGNQITSFGGGTQYTEADTDASVTGTAIMFESNTGTNTLSVVNNTTPLPVSDAGGSLTVDVGTALPAGTNAIGKLAANSGVDIGDVDVTSIAAGETHLGEVGGNLLLISTEKTRPADTNAYAANDCITNATSGASNWSFANAGRVSGGTGYITSAEVQTDQTTFTARLELELYAADITVINDNAECTLLYANVASHLKKIAFGAAAKPTTNSTCAVAYADDLRIPIDLSGSTTLYGLVRTLDAFTPASGQKFTINLHVDRN